MVNDDNPKILTQSQALALVGKAAQTSGALVGGIRLVHEKGVGITDPENRRMHVMLKAKGVVEPEIVSNLEKIETAINATDGVQLLHFDRDHGSPEGTAVIFYYAKNTGKP